MFWENTQKYSFRKQKKRKKLGFFTNFYQILGIVVVGQAEFLHLHEIRNKSKYVI